MKLSSRKWRPFCHGLNVLFLINIIGWTSMVIDVFFSKCSIICLYVIENIIWIKLRPRRNTHKLLTQIQGCFLEWKYLNWNNWGSGSIARVMAWRQTSDNPLPEPIPCRVNVSSVISGWIFFFYCIRFKSKFIIIFRVYDMRYCNHIFCTSFDLTFISPSCWSSCHYALFKFLTWPAMNIVVNKIDI